MAELKGLGKDGAAASGGEGGRPAVAKCLLAGALLLVAAIYLFWPSAEPLPALTKQTAGAEAGSAARPTQEQAQGRKEIKGWEQASAEKELHDPFTLSHEGRAEQQAMPQTVVPFSSSPHQLAERPAVPAGTPDGREKLPATPPAPAAAPRLCGLLHGPAGALAVVEADGKSYTLAQGESAGGVSVLAIEERRALIRYGTGELWLVLP